MMANVRGQMSNVKCEEEKNKEQNNNLMRSAKNRFCEERRSKKLEVDRQNEGVGRTGKI